MSLAIVTDSLCTECGGSSDVGWSSRDLTGSNADQARLRQRVAGVERREIGEYQVRGRPRGGEERASAKAPLHAGRGGARFAVSLLVS